MKKRFIAFMLALCLVPALAAAQRGDGWQLIDGGVDIIEVSPTIDVHNEQEIRDELSRAINLVTQPIPMDISGLECSGDPAMFVKNIYYDILSGDNTLFYAYDMQPIVDSNGILDCNVLYMPYKTGEYPDGFTGAPVNSLRDLIDVANANLGKSAAVNIRIDNPKLDVDVMSQALLQVGDSYFFCQLSSDGTQILIAPDKWNNGGSDKPETAFDNLARIDRLAQQVVNSCTNPGMSQLEKATALYKYLTDNVKYDYRYYNDPKNLPPESRTALGALEKHLAICGGYAQALQTLYNKVGIPCYRIYGVAADAHMWNVAAIDGKWMLFDATFDAGYAPSRWRYFNVPIESVTDHTPYNTSVYRLIEEYLQSGAPAVLPYGID